MSSKNKAQKIKISSFTPKQQAEFLQRCDKLYHFMLQKSHKKLP